MKQGICDIFFTSVTTGQYIKKECALAHSRAAARLLQQPNYL